MLGLTDAAAETIAGMRDRNGLPEDGGLRVAVRPASPSGDSDWSFALELVPAPVGGDEVVIGDAGAKVFLDPPAAEMLADKVLDVTSEHGGEIMFTLREQ